MLVFTLAASGSADGTFEVPSGNDEAPPAGGLDISSMLENMDLGAMGDMMKGRQLIYVQYAFFITMTDIV